VVFITPDVAENLVFIFTKEDPDAIEAVGIGENIGIEVREDGKFICLARPHPHPLLATRSTQLEVQYPLVHYGDRSGRV
jgi:hypothetical protein